MKNHGNEQNHTLGLIIGWKKEPNQKDAITFFSSEFDLVKREFSNIG